MDYKEKYEHAFEKAKEVYNRKDATDDGKLILESMFPELKENKDEMIRNFLISKMKEVGNVWKEYSSKDIIAWLEKQGEQKPADKTKSKFKIGDWIVQENFGVYKIIEICKSWYEVIDFKDHHHSICFDIEHTCHLWTIKDAKDGDVLVTNNDGICIFDGTVEDGEYPFAYCGITKYGFEFYDRRLPFTHSDVHPATKEQRDLLFTKMKEAGYEWNSEKKELKKIELKPAWSEEDEKYYQGCLHVMNIVLNAKPYPYYNDYLWLKSIKERIKGE